MIKIQIKSIYGSVLFEYEKENNTLKDTVTKAVNDKKDLIGADLRGADLRGASLIGACLRGAYLRGAYLRGAYLREASLRGAYLIGASLIGAYLIGASLRGASLIGADLRGAYLIGADLTGADLTGADLRGAYLTNGIKIKKAAAFSGLYKYITIPYITETDEKRIKLGCYDRLVSEWEENFWNNPDEFTDHDSEESKLRLFAFETAKKWLAN